MKSFVVVLAVLLAMPFLAAAQVQAEKLNLTLMTCTELECINKKDVFLVNESAYLDYNSTVKEISFSATLTFPDGTKHQITFPNRVISNVTGTYTFEITAWKEGYEETTVTKNFQIVEKLPETQADNLPKLDWFPFAFIAVLVVLIFASWRFHRRKSPKKPEGEKIEAAEKKSRRKR